MLCCRGISMKSHVVETYRPRRKARSRKRLATVFALAASVVIVVLIWYSTALRAAGGEEQTVSISQGASTSDIAAALKDKRLIKSPLAFRIHVKLNNLAKDFKSGTFVIAGNQTAPEIATTLTDNSKQNERFTIKEGLTQDQVADLLAKKHLVDKNEFKDLKAGDFRQYDFLASVPESASLEGFLFPETYDAPLAGTQTAQVAQIMLDQFGKELTPELREQIKDSGRSLYETVIIASIVEEEVRTDEDRRLVAGVLYKRLAEGIRLDADATLRYGLNKLTGSLTKTDLDSDNPYNTRKLKGLPPGPICNPGLSAIKAAINPQSSESLFYLSTKDGKTIFSKTLEEHEANVEKYLR